MANQLSQLLDASTNPAWFGDGRRLRCAYCGETTETALEPAHARRATRDHILAKAQGGRVTVPACRSCNQRKAGRQFADFIAAAETMALRARPGAKPWPEHELWAPSRWRSCAARMS